MRTPFYVYLGWDKREQNAYDVAKWSILRRVSKPVDVRPLKLGPLSKTFLTRPVERRDGKLWCPISQAPMATEFAISRFVVPLIQTEGLAVFADCDILCLANIVDLFALADPKYAVQVVKHDHQPTEGVKMDNQVQTVYSRKNWSSVVLWNCSHPSNAKLTKEVLNTWPGRDLHAFKWLADEEIGELPVSWNYLVGVTKPKPDPVHIAHFTLGTPDMPGYERSEFADEWRKELAAGRIL